MHNRRSIRNAAALWFRRVAFVLVGSLLLAWAGGAVYFLFPIPSALRWGVAAIYWISIVALLRRQITWSRRMLLLIVGAVLPLSLQMFKQPANDRMWVPEHRQLAEITLDRDQVQVRNLRSCTYRNETDFDVAYQDFGFELTDLTEVWFTVQRFTPLEGIAHNFLTFCIEKENDRRYVSVSVEIRREVGETFSPVKGLYREYELIYAVAEETDELGKRTVLRPNDRVYLYPVNATPEQVQQLFREIAARVNQLRDSPEFYHSLWNNCTNNIIVHTYPLTPSELNWLDPRVVAPGYADRFAYAQQLIGRPAQSFSELRTECRIDQIAKEVGFTPEFSTRIRRIGER